MGACIQCEMLQMLTLDVFESFVATRLAAVRTLDAIFLTRELIRNAQPQRPWTRRLGLVTMHVMTLLSTICRC